MSGCGLCVLGIRMCKSHTHTCAFYVLPSHSFARNSAMHSASMQVSVYTYAIACGNMHSHIFTETALRSEVRTYTHVLSQCQNRFSTICELACNCERAQRAS